MRQVLRELRPEQRSERAAQLNSVDPDEPFGERPLLPMDSIAFERRSFKNGQDEPTKNETAGVRHDALDPADRYERESSNEKLAIVWLTIFEHLPGCFLEGWEQARGTDNGDDDGPAKPQKIFGTSTSSTSGSRWWAAFATAAIWKCPAGCTGPPTWSCCATAFPGG